MKVVTCACSFTTPLHCRLGRAHKKMLRPGCRSPPVALMTEEKHELLVASSFLTSECGRRPLASMTQPSMKMKPRKTSRGPRLCCCLPASQTWGCSNPVNHKPLTPAVPLSGELSRLPVSSGILARTCHFGNTEYTCALKLKVLDPDSLPSPDPRTESHPTRLRRPLNSTQTQRHGTARPAPFVPLRR